jgi:DNA-binding IclR family transcriptional regulator
MIQVINRAFDMLEYIAKDRDKPKALSEIAGDLTLNAGTCANILKTMVHRNYVQKVDKQGYILGPLFYKLAGENSYRKHLVDAAKGEMEKLTKKVNESTILGVLNGDTRISVLIVEASNDLSVQSNQLKKAYNTSTGRLLIASLSEPELEKFINKYGLPEASLWKEVKSRKKLLEELELIRVNQYTSHVTDSQIIGLAAPVYQGMNVVASLGVYMPLFRYKNWKKGEVVKMLQATAKKISRNLG